MPQTNYGFAPEARGLPGLIASSKDGERVDSKIYAAGFHTQRITVGGTLTDGVYAFTVDGVVVTVTVGGGTPASNAALATALAAYGETLGALDNVANFTNPSSGVVEITAVQPGDTIPITNVTAPAPGTLTLSETVAATASVLQPGLFVARVAGSERQIRLPTTGDTDAVIAGVVLREDWASALNLGLESDVLGFEAGSMVPVDYGDDVWVLVDESTIAVGDPVCVRISGGASGQIGMVGNDTAAGARVTLTGCVFLTAVVALPANFSPTGAQGMAKVRINRPAA